MSRYVDIDALTKEVLASVEPEDVVKTASEETSDFKTEIGQALKNASVKLRAHNPNTVTYTDLTEAIGRTKTADLGRTIGGLAGGALGGALGTAAMPIAGTAAGAAAGSRIGANLLGGAPKPQPDTNAAQLQNPAAQSAKTGSVLGDQLRKIAHSIREQGAQNKEIRLNKAAQMLTAAVGLGHLTEGLK